jgi:4'-phosphopantetheinyl transferase
MNSPSERWQSPPENLNLKDGDETHLWRIDLKPESADTRFSPAVLSPDERRRAGKYHFEKDRKQFINARAALREILSRYLDITPNQVEFSCNRYGKPELKIAKSGDFPGFSFSRSREIALCAVTRKRRIGVDIEFINEEPANLEIAERFFSPSEIAALKNIPETLQSAAFYSVWTRKEAFIKAVGKGLSYPLQNFSVSIKPDEITPSLTINDSSENDIWTLFSFSPHPEYAAALAVEGSLPPLRFWGLS